MFDFGIRRLHYLRVVVTHVEVNVTAGNVTDLIVRMVVDTPKGNMMEIVAMSAKLDCG